MYEQSLSVKTEVSNSNEPVSARLIQRIEETNKIQCDVIDRISNKLHNLLNKRVPEKDPNGEGLRPMIQDFYSAMDNQVMLIQLNNSKLHKILTHLEEIV